MNNLKRLGLSFTLTAVLFTAVSAGETQTPPCAPGELSSPPCAAQPLNGNSADPDETLTPPAAPTVDVTDIAEAVLWALSLF